MLIRALKRTLPDPLYAVLRDVKRGVRSALYPADEDSRPRVTVGEFDGFRVAYRANTADEAVLGHSFKHDIFFPALPHYVPQPTDVILDVGAHIGTFTLLAATRVPEGIVHAVEASRESCDLLRINVGLNCLSNVEAHHIALSDSLGQVRLHHDLDGNWGHSITKALSRRGEEVRSEMLSRFLESNRLARIDLAKFNCEGAEFPILMSCPDVVLRRVERMLVLYHCELVRGHSLDELLIKLRGAGFSIELLKQEGTRGWIRTIRT